MSDHIQKKKLEDKKSKPDSLGPMRDMSKSGEVGTEQYADLLGDPLSPNAIIQLQGLIGNQAVLQLLRNKENNTGSVIQRAFQPARVSGNSHLRLEKPIGGVDANSQTGRKIPPNAEIIVDPANQSTQVRKVFKNVTWTRAVDKTAIQWNPATDPAATTYVRNSRIAPIAYPQPEELTLASRGTLTVSKDFHEDVGEYQIIEDSIDVPARKIIRLTRTGTFHSMTAAHVLAPLTALEQTQVNDVSREDAAENRLRLILQNAAAAGGLPNPGLLATNENIAKLKHPLRLTKGTGDQQQKNRWHEWSQAVFAKIAQGATEVVQSIMHWRGTIYPLDPTQAVITQIEMEGSDLHDKGLGALFVTYTKPNDANGMFPNTPSVKVVIKPEDRNIEKSLFGQQANSLANRINNLAHLPLNDQITTIKMETHANYGSIIEFVQGQQAKAINNTGVETQAMSEGIAFAFLAGMSDVHQDNVIWHNGKPYFIDADNSLNASKLSGAESQTGFSMYNKARTDTDVDAIKNNPVASRSAIIQGILANSTPFINAIRLAFTGKQGRIVPLYTNYWAQMFTNRSYMVQDEGHEGDHPNDVFTKWSIAKMAALKLKNGDAFGAGKGLVGECGTSSAGEFYNEAEEVRQIKADLDQGKIPFYHYDYSTGNILHNNQVIWHGQSLNDAMNVLLAKFPPP